MRNAECGLQSSAAWSPFWQCYAGARRVPRPQHSADMKSRKISGAKMEGNALRAETARAPQQCMDAPGRLRWSRQPVVVQFGGARLLTSRLARTLAPPKMQTVPLPASLDLRNAAR